MRELEGHDRALAVTGTNELSPLTRQEIEWMFEEVAFGLRRWRRTRRGNLLFAGAGFLVVALMLFRAGIAVGVLATLLVTATTAAAMIADNSSFVLETLREHPREISRLVATHDGVSITVGTGTARCTADHGDAPCARLVRYWRQSQ